MAMRGKVLPGQTTERQPAIQMNRINTIKHDGGEVIPPKAVLVAIKTAWKPTNGAEFDVMPVNGTVAVSMWKLFPLLPAAQTAVIHAAN